MVRAERPDTFDRTRCSENGAAPSSESESRAPVEVRDCGRAADFLDAIAGGKTLVVDEIERSLHPVLPRNLVSSGGVRERKCVELAEFVKRMNRHLDYHTGNKQVLSGFDFLTKVIGAWFPVVTSEKNLETPAEQE